MEYLIGGLIGGIIMYFVTGFAFMCRIESDSKSNKPFKAFGKVYFFMTQDQIQKAVKAIILFEKSIAKEALTVVKCKECGGKVCICKGGSRLWAAHCQDCDNSIGEPGVYEPCMPTKDEAIKEWNKQNEI